MKSEFLNVFASKAYEYMVDRFGRSADFCEEERWRWHERLGLLIDFSHEIVEDVAVLPDSREPFEEPAPDIVKLDANLQPMAPDALGFFAVYDNRQKLTILARNLGEDAHVSRNSGEPEKLIAALNESKELGFSDWRLPEVEEAFLLADRKRWNPAVDPNFFPWIKPAWYHTSTPVASAPAGYAWFVDFYGGDAYIYGRAHHGYVLAVRGGVPSPGQ